MAGINNPKQYISTSKSREARIFPYYAGYSEEFAHSVLDELSLPKESLVLDPWNGSGTTSIACYKKGIKSIGIDLNPVMILVSKASFISQLDIPSLLPLAHSLLNNVCISSINEANTDVLEKWFSPESASFLRMIEDKINKMFVSETSYLDLTTPQNLKKTSSIAAFFYVILFRVARKLIAEFIGSNPTWIKLPKNESLRKKIDRNQLKTLFINEVANLCRLESFFIKPDSSMVDITMGDAKALSIESESIDAVITSPPYCTRIDYAVATSLELAILRMSEIEYDVLRRSLIGTSTVSKTVCSPLDCWGTTCLNFLDDVKNHPSRASKSYYYKSHVQYYNALYLSLKEVSRVCKPEADLVFVVQGSHYKNIFNDLAIIVEEMGSNLQLQISQRLDFSTKRSMSALNPSSKKYVKNRENTESVLVFKKI